MDCPKLMLLTNFLELQKGGRPIKIHLSVYTETCPTKLQKQTVMIWNT
jgi:hypothetical protein